MQKIRLCGDKWGNFWLSSRRKVIDEYSFDIFDIPFFRQGQRHPAC